MTLRPIARRTLGRRAVSSALAAVAAALLVPASALASPSATTDPASDVTATSAVLNGTVQSDGLAATWHFDYATDAEFSGSGTYPHATSNQFLGVKVNTLPLPGVPVPTVAGVHANVSSLSPATTYHFRVVIEQNACLGTPLESACPFAPASAFGQDLTFKTLRV